MDPYLDKSRIKQIYSRLASSYDIWSRLAESKARKRSLELADINNGESVLEVAVGTGVLFEEVIKQNPDGRNEGLDITTKMLERSRKRLAKYNQSRYTLRSGDAYQLPYADNCFDVLLNNYMLDLIPEYDFLCILYEFKRVLRENGRLVLVNMSKRNTWLNSFWNSLYHLNPALVGGCRGIEIEPHVKAAGFQKIHIEYISQWNFLSEVTFAVKPFSSGSVQQDPAP